MGNINWKALSALDYFSTQTHFPISGFITWIADQHTQSPHFLDYPPGQRQRAPNKNHYPISPERSEYDIVKCVRKLAMCLAEPFINILAWGDGEFSQTPWKTISPDRFLGLRLYWLLKPVLLTIEYCREIPCDRENQLHNPAISDDRVFRSLIHR